jgi:quercetin dioxygenase-like cupin family protein
MKIKAKLVIGVAAVTALGGALATPVVGVLAPLLSVGNHNAEMHARGTATTSAGEPFKAEFETEGPATLSTQIYSVAAGGHNGWHSHPGMVFNTLVSGSIEWYDENCTPTIYAAGDSWVEGSQPHAYRVISATAIQAVGWFVTAHGQPLRTDLPAPSCAAALGL